MLADRRLMGVNCPMGIDSRCPTHSGEPAVDHAMCAVPRKRRFPERRRLSEVLDARQGFKPFRLAEAYDQASLSALCFGLEF